MTKKQRFEILKRDGFRCVYCGRVPPGVVLEVDHVVARANGGTDDDFNLVTSCFDCNHGKMARPLDKVPLVKTEFDLNRERRMAERVKQVEQMLATAKAEKAKLEALLDWLWQYWLENSGAEYESWNMESYRKDVKRSVQMFLEHLEVGDVVDAIQITGRAVARGTGRRRLSDETAKIRYFAGVCWNKIKRPDEWGAKKESEESNVRVVATVGEHH